MLNTKKLRNDINKKLDNWNERSQFTLGGVKNLSRSDMDILIMLCDMIDKVGIDEHLIDTVIMISPEIKNVIRQYGWEEV